MGMKISEDKTKMMAVNSSDTPTLFINWRPVKAVLTLKLLGATIDAQLSWEPQIDLTCRKIEANIRAMKL